MTDLAEIARAEEARLAVGLAEIADASLPVAGGTAARGEPGTWINTAAGMGFRGAVSREDLAAAATWYESSGIEPRFEVCPYAHPSLLTQLAALGFTPRCFDNIFARHLPPGDDFPTPNPAPPELIIATVDPAEAIPLRAGGLAFIDAITRHFYPEGVEPPSSHFDLFARCLAHPRTIALAAHLDGRIVGGGFVEIHERVAALFGLSVIPACRRRGIQSALVAARLRLARDRGAQCATIGSQPGQGTERNVLRMGFSLAYTKLVVARPGPDLAPVRP